MVVPLAAGLDVVVAETLPAGDTLVPSAALWASGTAACDGRGCRREAPTVRASGGRR